MVRIHDYDSEMTGTRDEIAAVLRGVADGIAGGSVRLGDGTDAVSVGVADEIDLEVEFEAEDDELSLELELEWPSPSGDGDGDGNEESAGNVAGDGHGDGADDGDGAGDGHGDGVEAAEVEGDDTAVAPIEDPPGADSDRPVGTAGVPRTLARFELFRDRGEEWRWRLRHRNGNVIATSGEGYTRKHNAQKGLRSVVRNAPEAAVVEDSGD